MSTRSKLLELLDGKAGQKLSGENLARRLGISRTAVWKQIQSMKEDGMPIESLGRLGYSLKRPFDNSLARFRSALGKTVPHYFPSTASTQTPAKAGAAAGLAENHIWIAETQTKGRGRLDRLWDSQYGGLWFSLLLRPKLPPSRVPPLTLVAGLCLRDAVEKVSGLKVRLKWPNDLVIEKSHSKNRKTWAKLAGILTEMSGQTDRTEWVVIGVGLNVNNAIAKSVSIPSASLLELTGRAGKRADYLEAFLKLFDPAYSLFQKEGFEPFRKRYWANYFEPEKSVRLNTAVGLITGRARGVDASGAIMIESRRKIRLISEGEIIS